MKDEARANSIQGIYAHSKPNAEVSFWQTLADHSEAVGTLASKFAKGFGSHVLGGIVGRIHDLGKASAAFQGYLRRCNGLDDAGLEGGGTSHSGAGACWLYKNLGNIGKALSYCVAGHHAGLPDLTGGVPSSLPSGVTALARASSAATIPANASKYEFAPCDSSPTGFSISFPLTAMIVFLSLFWYKKKKAATCRRWVTMFIAAGSDFSGGKVWSEEARC